MNTQDVLDWVKIVQSIVTILAIIGGAVWSWYQFSIGDLLKPNFSLIVELVSVNKSSPKRLAVVRVTVRNIGKTTVVHADSGLRVFPIRRSELEELEPETSKRVLEIAEAGTPVLEVQMPFSPVYLMPESWGRHLHPGGEYPFVLRPDEQISVDIPITINDPSVVALEVISSFHCTHMERVRVGQGDSPSSPQKVQYGVHSKHVFDLSVSDEVYS